MRSVRAGVSLYRWALLAGLAVQLTGVVLIFVNPDYLRLSSASSAGGLSFAGGGGGTNGATLALTAVDGLLGLASLILSIVAFVRWRSGVLELRRTVPPSAPFQPSGAAGPAALADSHYRAALWTMLVWLLAVIAGAVVIGVALVGNLHLMPNANGTVPPPTTSQVNNAVASILPYAVGLGVVLLVLQLVLAHFVTGSLSGIVQAGGRRASIPDLGTTRALVFLGVLFGAAGFLNLIVVGPGAIALVGTVLLLLACQRYLTALEPSP